MSPAHADDSAPPPLALVLCPAFHGATVLSILLNNHSQVSALGDLLPGRAYDQTCACGALVSECPFWRELGRRVGSERFLDEEYLIPDVPRLARHRGINRALNLGLGLAGAALGRAAWAPVGDAAREWVETNERFERAVLELQGARILVDGQKGLVRALALRSLDPRGRPLRIVHLVRDPRGFRASSKRGRESALERDAAEWRRKHGWIPRLAGPRAGYLRVRHEDLCADPERVMASVFRFLGLPPEPVVGPPRDRERQYHLMGNALLARFDGEVRLEERWREELSADEQRRMLALTRPLSEELGYREAPAG